LLDLVPSKYCQRKEAEIRESRKRGEIMEGGRVKEKRIK
jgi:hypothetical protein